MISVWLLCTLAAIGQSSFHVRSRQLNAENGLKTNYVRNIVQDPRGYLWLGATNGLIRYDGYTAELLTPDSLRNKLLLDERVQSVELWLDRFIWIRLRGRKFSCYDTQTNQFVDYTGENSISESFRYSKILDNGELWLFDPEEGCKVIHYDNHQFSCQRKPYTDAPKQQETKLPVAITTSLSGTSYEVIKDNRDNPVAITESGELWYFNHKTGRITHLNNIYSKDLVRLNGKPRIGVVTDKDGMIWVSTYGNGLFVHHPQTGETTHFFKQLFNTAPIQTNYLLSIYEDRAGNIWVCQEDMGVACISKQGIKTDIVNFSETGNLDHSNSIHLLSRVGDRIYVGNRYNGLKIADGLLNFTQELSGYNDDIVAVCQDDAGVVWMGTRQSGIFVGKQNLRHENDRPESLTGGKISDIVCDTQGRMWISFFDGGVDLAVADGKGGYTFRHFFTGKQSVVHPRQLMVDHGGYIWLTSDVGLFVFLPEKLIENPAAYQRLHVNNETPESDEIHCICEDSRHGVVVGTAGRGVAVFDNRNPGHAKLFQTFTTENGLPHNNIQQIIEDDQGYVWVGTDRGLARYDTKGGRTISLQPSDTPQGNMFVENAVCRLDDGRLAFGSRQGIVLANPHSVSISKPLFKLRITNFEVNGVNAQYYKDGQLVNELNSQDGRVILSHNENSLIFRFSDFEYNEGLTTRYTYRLQGYDKDWSPLSAENDAIYKNLEPGDYTFEVKALNSDNEWNEAVITLPVTIRPPFWNTWLAYLIYIVIAFIIAWTAFRYFKRINELRNRIKVEQQLTEYKMRFFTNISHEFRTPLTIIRGAMERVHRMDNIPADMKQPLYSMHKSSERLMRMINQLLEFSKMHENKLQLAVEETEVVGFLREIFSTFKDMAETKHISYLFTTNAKTITALVDRSYLDKIAYNLISNAFKYTPSHHDITVRVIQDESLLRFLVEDTGVGIPKEKQKELFERFNQSVFSRNSIGIGLHLTNELVRVHHGTIVYEENPKGGSIFTVSLPLDRNVYSENELMKTDNAIAIEEEENKSTLGEEYREMPSLPINKRKILVVEDDSDVRNYLQHELQRYFVIESANDGKEALEKVDFEKPELIVTDAIMPVMDGFELIRHIRSNDEWNDIPIIMLTALTNEEDNLKGIKAGAEAYIRKPFSSALLITRISKLLEQRDKLKVSYTKEVVGHVTTPEVLINEADRRLRDQMEVWMKAHINDTQVSAESFAQGLGYGRTNFFKKVKQLMGMSPNDYIRKIRMEAAAELLLTTNMTAAEIAYKVGFEDQYYFSKSFKKYFGLPPSQYRRGDKPKTESSDKEAYPT